VAIAVWGNRGPTIVRLEEGPQAVHVNMRHGTVVSVDGTASGLLFAAHRSAAEVEAVLAAEGTGRTRADLAPQLDRVRAQGWNRAVDGSVHGVTALAASARLRTSRMTVFMVPPRDIRIEILHQLLGRREAIVVFLVAPVPVIAFAALVVVSNHALAMHHIGSSRKAFMLGMMTTAEGASTDGWGRRGVPDALAQWVEQPLRLQRQTVSRWAGARWVFHAGSLARWLPP
jgi:hypothetical protein